MTAWNVKLSFFSVSWHRHINSFQMPKINKSTSTRNSFRSNLLGGSPCEPKQTQPYSNRDIVRYYYFLTQSCGMEKTESYHKIVGDVKAVWRKINTELPVQKDLSIWNKVKRFCEAVCKVNSRKCKNSKLTQLIEVLDNLFDISACTCTLPIAPCSNKMVKCIVKGCKKDHIICECSPDKKVPLVDRAYLKELRDKGPSKCKFQMAGQEPTCSNRNIHIKSSDQHLKELITTSDNSVTCSTSDESSLEMVSNVSVKLPSAST